MAPYPPGIIPGCMPGCIPGCMPGCIIMPGWPICGGIMPGIMPPGSACPIACIENASAPG